MHTAFIKRVMDCKVCSAQVKGFASKGKTSITAKYSKKEDAVELLNRSSTSNASMSTRTSHSFQPRRGEPPSSDLFDDI